MKRTLIFGFAATFALSAGSALPAYAHGGGVLRVASKQIASGGTIVMRGEKMGNNANMKAELRGVLDNYPLGNVRATPTGTLSASLTVPPTVPVGTYTLVLVAEDGDVAGRAEVMVGPPGAAEAVASGMPHLSGAMPEMPEMTATGEMMKLDIKTSAGEWAAIAALVLLSFGAGAALLAKSRRTPVR